MIPTATIIQLECAILTIRAAIELWLNAVACSVLRVYLLSGCSRTFEQEYGYLKSPGWPEVYPHNLDCIILLKAPQNSSMSLFFNSFDVESHSSCQFDYLEVNLDTWGNFSFITSLMNNLAETCCVKYLVTHDLSVDTRWDWEKCCCSYWHILLAVAPEPKPSQWSPASFIAFIELLNFLA